MCYIYCQIWVMLQTVREKDSLFSILLEVDIFRVNYRPICRREKGYVLYAFESFASTWPDLHEALQNFSVCLKCSTVSGTFHVQIQFLSQCQSRLALWAYNYVTCLRSGSWGVIANSDIIPMSLLLSGYVLVHLELISLGRELRCGHGKCKLKAQCNIH